MLLPTRMFDAACGPGGRAGDGGRASFLLLLTLVLTVVTGITSALKDVTVVVPLAATIGDTVTLQCRYDLEGEPLYTLKWYKGAHEFYRFIPKELPSTQIFPYQNLDVDLAKSNQNSIVLRNLQAEHTGRYKCEVSTDSPNFFTRIENGYMHVINVPEGKPEVFIENGDNLRANCTAPVSYPSMNLTWFVNGKKTNNSYLTHLPGTNVSFEGRKKPMMTVIGLEYSMDNSLFHDGKANIRCAAELFGVYKAQREVVLEQEKPQQYSVLQNNNGSAPASAQSRSASSIILLIFSILLLGVITR